MEGPLGGEARDPLGLLLWLRGLGWVGGSCRKVGPGFLLALPFKIQPSVEAPMGIPQARSILPVPWGRVLRMKACPVPSHSPLPQTVAFTPSLRQPPFEEAGTRAG